MRPEPPLNLALESGPRGVRAWLYDVDSQDAPADATAIRPADLSDTQILWVDVDLEQFEDLTQLWTSLGVGDELHAFDKRPLRPSLGLHENVMQLNVNAIHGEEADVVPVVLHCLLGKNWVATLHEGEFGLVEEFNRPMATESHLGELDAAAFLSVVLDWQLNEYFRRIEQLQGQIDRVDEELLKPSPTDPSCSSVSTTFAARRQS